MEYYGYDYDGTEQYRLLGIRDSDGVLYDIIQLLGSNISILENENLVKLVLIGNALDVQVIDSDEYLTAINQYNSFEMLKNNKKINSVLPIDSYETKESEAWKKKLKVIASRCKDISLEEFNRMFLQRYKFNRQNTDGAYISNHPDILMMETVVKNSDEETRRYIGGYIRTLPAYRKRFENKVVMGENQRIFFNATDHSVMPEVEDVASIEDGSADMYLLKKMVPEFHKLIGGYVNYRRGSEEGSYGSYTSGEYIKNSDTAMLINSHNYRDILAGKTNVSTSAYKQTVIGGRKVDITDSYIIGDSDYDNDDIRSNESEYYEVLKKFVDDCLEYDLTKASISNWKSCGLNVDKYLPELDVNAHRSFEETSYKTFKMIDSGSEDSFNKSKLAEFGITVDAIKNECVGTPTANRWFSYAINLALMSTRAYTGFIPVPFGYDNCDFDDSYSVPKNTIDAKYDAYTRGMVWYVNRWLSAEEYDSRINSDSEDATVFDDYHSINGERAYDYWSNVDSEIQSNSDDDSYSADGFTSTSYNRPDLLRSVMSYCTSSGNFYALVEALIKCLRFGMKKPKCLQISGVGYGLDLTTTALRIEVTRDNPVPIISSDVNKIYLISKIVVINHNNISSVLHNSKEFKFGSSDRDIIIGVGLRAKYMQADGHTEVVTDYYDMDTFNKEKELQSKIINFDGQKLIDINGFPASKIVIENAQDVMANLLHQSSTTSVVLNDNIYSNVVSKYLKGIEDQEKRRDINSLNRKGFNMFSMCNHLIKIKDIITSIRFIGLEKDADKIASSTSIMEIENLMYVKALTLYGNVFNHLLNLETAGDIKSRFNSENNVWREIGLYELVISSKIKDNAVSSSKSYFEEISNKIPKGEEYDVGVVVLGGKPLFYILRNSKLRKFIALDKDKLKSSELYKLSGKEVVNGKMTGGSMNLNKIVSSIMVYMNKNNKTADEIIDTMFVFYDKETEVLVRNLIKNNIKR